MKKRLTIFLLLTCVRAVTYGQTCDTIDGLRVNCIDSNGQRQGLWMERKKQLEYSMHSGLGSKEGCRYSEVYSYKTIAVGFYKDNKKNGPWAYSREYDDNDSTWYSNGKVIRIKNPDYTITKLDNGNIREKSLRYDYEIEYNSDTSLLVGQIFLRHDTIAINCKDKLCNFKTKDGFEFLSFTTDKLEDKLLLLSLGEYNRDIRLKQTSR